MKNIIRQHLNTIFQSQPVTREYSPTTHIYFVLLVSGVGGFCLGMFMYPTWQIAVEGAQVIAHVVHYSRENLFYIPQTKMWTLLHQVCAVFLRWGVSERILSLVLCGVSGMLSFQAISLCVLSFCHKRFIAIAAPCLIFLSRAYDFGIIYPVRMMDFHSTYGVVGLSFIGLGIGFLANRQYKVGGILLGIAPSLHCSLGGWIWGAVFLSCLWDYHNRFESFRKLIPPFLAGAAISGISLLVHFLITYDVPAVSHEIITTYRDICLRQWDAHRIQVDFHSMGMYLNIVSICMGFFCLTYLKKEIPRHVLFVLRIVVVCAIGGIAFSVIPLRSLPLMVHVLMPTRMLNMAVLLFCGVLIGLLSRFQHRFSIQWCLTAFITTLGLVGMQVLSHDWVPVSLYSVPFLLIVSLSVPHDQVKASSIKNTMAVVLKGITLLIVVLIMGVVIKNIYNNRHRFSDALHDDWVHDAFFQEVAHGEGLLLTAPGIDLIQLRTRRPLLLNSESIDILVYTPEIGPEFNRMLQRIYGVDLFTNESCSSIPPPEISKLLWEGRSIEEWRTIKEEFEVYDIITYSDWTLPLPITAHNGQFILYHIPD